MMPIKDAIEILKREKPIHDTRKCGIELCKAVDVVIEELEKQMPKKPKVKEWIAIDDVVYTYHCPCCGIDLMGCLSEPDHDPYYCFECGQALSWEEDDD